MNEGRDSDLSLRITQVLVLGPWGGALLVLISIVILLGVPGWTSI